VGRKSYGERWGGGFPLPLAKGEGQKGEGFYIIHNNLSPLIPLSLQGEGEIFIKRGEAPLKLPVL